MQNSDIPIFGKARKGVRTKVPYEGTEVPPETTKTQIDDLLRSYGASKIQWTEDGGAYTLRYMMTVELKGVRKEIGVELKPPIFLVKRKSYNRQRDSYNTFNTPNTRRSLRLLFYYVKAKVESITFGLTTAEQEFMAHVIVNLPGGESSTVGKLVSEAMAKGTLDTLALESRPAQERQIEAEARVVAD